jgi:hypothetical protein
MNIRGLTIVGATLMAGMFSVAAQADSFSIHYADKNERVAIALGTPYYYGAPHHKHHHGHGHKKPAYVYYPAPGYAYHGAPPGLYCTPHHDHMHCYRY